MSNRIILWLLRRFTYVRDLERTKQDYSDYLLGKTTIKDIAIRNGSMTMEVSTEMIQVFAEQIAAFLDGHAAENYVEVQLNHEDGRRFAVIVQRCEGKTPHEKRVEAENELKKYLAATNEQQVES